MEILFNLVFIPIILVINNFLVKNKYLLNYSGLKHQLYTSQKSIPISGGLILLIFYTINYQNYDVIFLASIYIFFLIAILGDLNLIKSTFLRFFLQITFVIFFIW